MRHRVDHKKFSRPTGHRLMMLRNLVTDLLRYEKVETTAAKARAARRLADKMITLGKEGTLAARRQAIAFLTDERVAQKVFDVLAKRYADRNGGYTRIVKLGYRKGDGAEVARVELV